MSSVIEEFLIGLGVKLDEAALRKFQEHTSKSRKGVLALGAAVAATAAAVEVGIKRMADKFESLYYASQRTKSSVENIQALGYAMSKLGGQSEDALSMLDSLSSFMRGTPGGGAFLAGIGVATQDANGQLRDTADILEDLGAKFRQMQEQGQFYLAKGYASVLGISEPQLLVLMRDTKKFGEEYHKLYQIAGTDAQDVAKKSMLFRNELRGIGAATEILWDKTMGHFLGGRLNFATRVREWIFSHYEQINQGLDFLLGKLDALADWFEEGFKAAQAGEFLPWLQAQWQRFMDWLADGYDRFIRDSVEHAWIAVFRVLSWQWKQHGAGVVEVLDGVMRWFREAFIGLADDISTYLGDAIGQALRDQLPDWAQKYVQPHQLSPEEELRRELRQEERRRQIEGAKSALTNAAGAALDFLVPTASANTETPEAGISRMDRVEQAFRFFREKGLSAAQAAGIVGNLLQENSDLNPSASGDNGGAKGIAQWHGSRQAGMGNTLMSQLQHVWDEMTGGAANRDVGAERALGALRGAGSAADAAKAFHDNFERSGVPMMGNRIGYANQVMRQFGGMTVNIHVAGNLDKTAVPDIQRGIASATRNMGRTVW